MVSIAASPDDSKPSVFVGTCGIADPGWLGNFYPRGLRQEKWLEYYAKRFNSIELNCTFHSVPSVEVVRRWAQVTPEGFKFWLKFPQEVTHKLLPGAEQRKAGEVARRFCGIVSELGEKLAGLLIQLPPSFGASGRSVFYDFLDRWVSPVPLAVEFRHETWWRPEIAAMLRERRIAWAAADLVAYPQSLRLPKRGRLRSSGLFPLVHTGDLLYVRLIGKHHQFTERREHFDSRPRVEWWCERIARVVRESSGVKQVYVFVDNDFSGHAPYAAWRVVDQLGLPRWFGEDDGLFGQN